MAGYNGQEKRIEREGSKGYSQVCGICGGPTHEYICKDCRSSVPLQSVQEISK